MKNQSLRIALQAARIVTPIFFMAHAAVRIANGSIPQFAGFMADKGFGNGFAVVWAITAYELLAGTMILFGSRIKLAAAGLACIVVGGIVLIHAQLGWFVGEHGTGGSEYSVALLILLAVISAADGSGIYGTRPDNSTKPTPLRDTAESKR